MKVFLSEHQDSGPLSTEPLDEQGYTSLLTEVEASGTANAPPLDAMIHGVRARLHTDNVHWRQFWSSNWFAPDQWASLIGNRWPVEAKIEVYAVTADVGGQPWAGYSHEHRAVFLLGNTPYGQLRALVWEAVARLLAEEEAADFFPGICMIRNGQGMLVLGSDGLTAPALAKVLSALMAEPDVHLVALQGVVVRYGLVRMVDGVTLLPAAVIDEKGHRITGYRLFPWLDEYGYWEPRADARCLTRDGYEEYCFSRDLDLGRAPEAFGFPVEQSWYVPTCIVAAEPHLVEALWKYGMLENVVPLDGEGTSRFGAWAREAASSLGARGAATLDGLDEERMVEALVRLRASPNGRAVIAPQYLWPSRVSGNPGHPLQIERLACLDEDRALPLAKIELSEKLSAMGPRWLGLGGEKVSRALTTMLERAIGGKE